MDVNGQAMRDSYTPSDPNNALSERPLVQFSALASNDIARSLRMREGCKELWFSIGNALTF